VGTTKSVMACSQPIHSNYNGILCPWTLVGELGNKVLL